MNPSEAIKALQDAGWTELRIAREVGATQPTINRVKRGSEPSYGTGAALVKLAEHELRPLSAPKAGQPKKRAA